MGKSVTGQKYTQKQKLTKNQPDKSTTGVFLSVVLLPAAPRITQVWANLARRGLGWRKSESMRHVASSGTIRNNGGLPIYLTIYLSICISSHQSHNYLSI